MVQRTRVPILLLTGFLGSGKTSLLSKWLRAPELAGAMVIVNELGEVGLDDSLVQFSSDGPVLLENGCACCEAAEDLAATLERLFWQRLHRQIPRFEWMLIETTGIADPAPIMASIVTNDLVAERYRLAGTVTAFDARRGPDLLAGHPECRSQIMQADVIVITKTDLALPDEIAVAEQAIARLRPDACIMRSALGDLPAAAILAALQTIEARPSAEMAMPAADHSPDVTSAFAPLPEPVSAAPLNEALARLMQRYGKRLLRLKGIADIDHAGNARVIQAAPGEPVDITPMPQGKPETAARRGLTIISQFVPAELLARDFLSMLPFEKAMPDMPVFPQHKGG